ncbi:Sulfite reductase [NADPH] flavoprotein alpha-component [Thalassocella blandensis]|nr:Sulfite reductase [NADPH] flavoprotein alpha-component [Thalassocella blandensis]
MSDLERLLSVAVILCIYALLCRWSFRSAFSAPANNNSEATLLVAYASQSGTAAGYAKTTFDKLTEPARLLPMNELTDDILVSTKRVLFVVSTYGEGEAPDNGQSFIHRYLHQSSFDFSHIEFSILSLGDSSYPNFCWFGKFLESELCRLHARVLFDSISLDASKPNDSAISQWYNCLAEHELIKASAIPAAQDSERSTQGRWQTWILDDREWLNPESPGEPLYRLVFTSQNTSIHWHAGEIAEVHPFNDTQQKIREYSVSTIPQPNTNQIPSTIQLELIVRVHSHQQYTGLCSSWLCYNLAIGESVKFKLRPNPQFRTPPTELPLILIGSGSGYAGLRSHLKARESDMTGDNWLIFGERSPQADNIFADELDSWMQNGNLTHLHRAFSRCSENPSYVQDVLRQQKAQLLQWVANGAVIMVCGSRLGMAKAVDDALNEFFGSHMLKLIEQGRYRRDIY